MASTGAMGHDLRGKHHNKGKVLPQEVYQSVVDHIRKFPKVESHYCRQDTKKVYFLENNLNISKMYRLYVNSLSESQIKLASKSMYRSIFKSFRIAFNKPKKDMCDVCKSWTLLSAQDKIAQKVSYDLHIRNKNLA